MWCPKGHPMALANLPAFRGHLHSHQCGLCSVEIPQPAPRHRCRRCRYDVCYDCGLRLALPSGYSSESDGSSGCSEKGGRCLEKAKAASQAKFWARVDRHFRRREVHVAISKFYDTVSPMGGTRRTRGHCRRREAVAEDCHFAAYSDAQLSLAPLPSCGARVVPVETASPAARPLLDSPQRDLADGVLQRAAKLMEIVGSECFMGQDCLDQEWNPDLSKLSWEELGLSAVDFCTGKASLLTWLLGGADLQQRLAQLCLGAEEILRAQPILSEVNVPAKVYGDVHGQLRDMLLLFHFYGWPGASAGPGTESSPATSYVFNGDWVDRGRHQVECVAILLALKIAHPERVWLNRGNHEDVSQNLKTSREHSIGFDKACDELLGQDLGPEAFKAFHNVFDWLPLAARIGGRALVLHGGLGSGEWTLEDLKSVQRPLTSAGLVKAMDGAVYNILWSDPLQADRHLPVETFGVHQSYRSRHNKEMQTFGRDVTERFCARENLSVVIRSHQFRKSGKGYELMHDGWLMRVFSARNYNGRHANDGGLLLVGRASGALGTLLIRPQVVERMVVSQVVPMRSISEPYCPKAHLMHLDRRGGLAQGCGLRFPWQQAPEPGPSCAECSAELLQEGCFYSCKGCLRYALCLGCACGRRVATPHGMRHAVPCLMEAASGSESEEEGEVAREAAARPVPLPPTALSAKAAAGPSAAPPAGAPGTLPTLLASRRFAGAAAGQLLAVKQA